MLGGRGEGGGMMEAAHLAELDIAILLKQLWGHDAQGTCTAAMTLLKDLMLLHVK